jgi:hypothetical protein
MHYFDIYEHHFERFRETSPIVVEVGVSGGGSLAMWKEYFGPRCRIIGIDIDPKCKAHESDGIEVFVGSQDDADLIDSLLRKYGSPNVVIDDGSHMMEHVTKTFQLLYPRLDATGVYLVEDTHTCYWQNYGGGLRREGTFIETCKHLVDELNAVHTRGALPVSEFTRTTDSICFYDSVVVFERRPQGIRQAPVTGPME